MVDLKQSLQFFYWLMVASEGLLDRAIEKSDGRLHDYYLKHFEEEEGHVQWLTEDLQILGVEPCQDYLAASIAGSQYYLIEHNHPAMLLGYMAVLESNPMTLDKIDQLEEVYGPLKTLRYHSEHDPEHFQDLLQEIEALDEPLKSQVKENSRWVAFWITDVLNRMDKETKCHF